MAGQYRLPGSPGADSIPFTAAIVLAVAFFIAAVIRLGGYFLPRSEQPIQLIVSSCGLWPASWLCVIKKCHWCQVAYVCLLLVNIGIVGLYELEACWQINTTIFPWLQENFNIIGILKVVLDVGLCVWFGNNNKEISSILVLLLCSVCILYSFISFSYLRLLPLGRKRHPHLLGSGVLCIFIVVSIVGVLCAGGAKKLPGGLISSTWIALAIVGISTLRIPCRRWWNRDQLFGCRGDSEELGIYVRR